MSKTFVSECLSGEAMLDDIDDWVQNWHELRGDVSLDNFLGFTEEEGDLWAERPEALRYIIAAHATKRPVYKILESRDELAVAARSTSPEKAAAVLAWLRENDRIPNP